MRNHCFLPGPIATGLVLLRLRIECVCARICPRSAQAETREIPSSSRYDESGEHRKFVSIVERPTLRHSDIVLSVASHSTEAR